ncbi:hypothetical protein [Candidatus Albibeggiatoa sp. nov. BB20]|uniref:hypothetical protein n=1 Tax=Candidatus Albibeggiatoa sp. nov. BB20 TaxID=3162723 RepID=UPI0033654CDD
MDTDHEDCYCYEREYNSELAEVLKEIPEGYCGVCDICGGWGHTRAHPRLPVTGAWCDEHWRSLVNYRIISLADIIHVVGLFLIVAIFGYMIWQLLTGLLF